MIKIQGKLPRSVYVACSGGADSMAIVDFLSRNHDVEVIMKAAVFFIFVIPSFHIFILSVFLLRIHFTVFVGIVKKFFSLLIF
jgi:asparagine synthetase B (glutamine-hydrolysing)